MGHDDGDWDSQLAQGIFDALIYSDGEVNWVTVVVFAIGLALAAWHYWG